MTKLALILGVVALCGSAGSAVAQDHGHDHAKPKAPVKASGNPVVHEMRLLNDAMKTIMDAVANNRLEAIVPAIHRVHEARLLTEKAIESGTYRLPKNSDRMEAFIKEDDAFHQELVTLVKAARANDLKGATKQVGTLMNGCTSCHVKYRF